MAAPSWGGTILAGRRGGFYASTINGDPKPPRVGFYAAYNAAEWMRFTAGYGLTQTYGGGIKFMVPGWNLTPIIGLNYSHLGPIPSWIHKLDFFGSCKADAKTCIYPTHAFDYTFANGI